jgi:uncharacterized protein (TIGR03083 family)
VLGEEHGGRQAHETTAGDQYRFVLGPGHGVHPFSGGPDARHYAFVQPYDAGPDLGCLAMAADDDGLDDGLDEPLLLAQCWQYWAERCVAMSDDEWATPTRCPPWDVAALVAHVAPDPAALRGLAGSVIDGEPAVTDAALLLQQFNASGGPAHAMAAEVASRATEKAMTLGPVDLVGRFVESGAILLGEAELPPATVVPYPVAGSVTVAVLTAMAIVEATVHYLDLLDAVGGEPLPVEALDYTRDILVRVSAPGPLIEAVTGRRNPLTWFPLVR